MDDLSLAEKALLVFGGLFVAGVIALLIYAIPAAIIGNSTNNRCLHQGWPQSEVTWNFERYCHKRIQQTDSVVRLEVLERKP